MNPYSDLIVGIDFEHWNGKNPYFSDADLNKSMRAALTLIKKRGYLQEFNPNRAIDYVTEIENEISTFDTVRPSFERLSYIFDLIQAWGGQTGRTPYVKRRAASHSSREQFDTWKENYLKGIIHARDDFPVKALQEWVNIEGLGASFSPKHLRFWTSKYPILDSRISLLLCGSKKLLLRPEGYGIFLDLISQLSERFDASILEMEKALFAFSKNYFLNDSLTLNASEYADSVNLEIAEKIASL